MRGQELYQIVINAGLFTFHIHCVHEEFGTTGGELAQDGFVQGHFGEGLPTIGHHPIPATAQATGKIQHQPLGADGLGQRGKASLIQSPFVEHPGGDDYVGCPGIEPAGGVVEIDAAADLESTGISGEGFPRFGFIAGAKLDHVPAT